MGFAWHDASQWKLLTLVKYIDTQDTTTLITLVNMKDLTPYVLKWRGLRPNTNVPEQNLIRLFGLWLL
jgi:hypothetical protein